MNSDASSPHWPCAWLRLDAHGALVAANDALGRLVERPQQELLGIRFDALLSGPSRVLYQSYLLPLVQLHGNVEEVSLSLNIAHGATVEVLFYSARQTDEFGADYLDVVLAPIRRRRGIEDEMLRIKRAADQSPGLIFQLIQSADGSLHFPYISEAVRRLYAVTPEVVRQSANALLGCIADQDRSRLVAAIRVAAAAGRDWSGVFRVTLADGSRHWHELHCTPRMLANQVLVWHGHIADVTARRELEITLAEREAADRSNRMQSEFLARVSHELRTPLNGIIGFSQLLESNAGNELGDTQRHWLSVIRSSGQHLLGLVNQVLEISSLEAGQRAPEPQAVPLQSAIIEAMELVQAQADAAGVLLQPADCADSLQVRASSRHLSQVLVNLLSNAIKYNHSGGQVTVSASRRLDEIAIAISDTGPGLSESQQAQLFQAFNRLGAQNTNAEGTGLGLVITQHLLKVMNGSIEVLSAPGAGSTFTILLPASDGSATAVAVAAPSCEPITPQDVAACAAAASSRLGPRAQVLYVEDNPVNILLMEAILGTLPTVSLKVAKSGAAALEVLTSYLPDLLLLDMQLPDTTGNLLLARIRVLHGMLEIPAVAVSAAARAEDVAAALEQGFDSYWTKPLDIDRTLVEIQRWLDIRMSRT